MRTAAQQTKYRDAIHDLQGSRNRAYATIIEVFRADYETLKERLVDQDDAVLRGRAQQLRDILAEYDNNQQILEERYERPD